MSELRKEYRKIFDEVCRDYGVMEEDTRDAMFAALGEAQALADKPPRELTDFEIFIAFDPDDADGFKATDQSWFPRIKAVIAAHIAKQREPVTVKLRMVHLHCSGKPFAVFATYQLSAGDRWVSAEFDSPPIEGV